MLSSSPHNIIRIPPLEVPSDVIENPLFIDYVENTSSALDESISPLRTKQLLFLLLSPCTNLSAND
jgi:hypothetical protein